MASTAMAPRRTNDPMPGYGERLRRRRLAENRTRQNLADAVGVSYDTVGRWETEKNVPTDGTVVRIARYLHTTASWILYNDNPNGRDA
jgi:transcriptional regulator with XRE-family HTH domain